MKKFLTLFIIFLPIIASAKNTGLSGYWLQISDQTKQPHSIIQITQNKNQISGKVIRAFPQNGKAPDKYCLKCKGKLYRKPIIGMKILWGFKKSGENKWDNGKILDPKTGKIYRCNLMLFQKGKFLKVRGYIGFSLFGRTQIWERIKLIKN